MQLGSIFLKYFLLLKIRVKGTFVDVWLVLSTVQQTASLFSLFKVIQLCLWKKKSYLKYFGILFKQSL